MTSARDQITALADEIATTVGDARLATAKKLAEAKRIAVEAGLDWQHELDTIIRPRLKLAIKRREIDRLIEIGSAPDPQAALSQVREASRERSARRRQVSDVRTPIRKVDPVIAAVETIKALPAPMRREAAALAGYEPRVEEPPAAVPPAEALARAIAAVDDDTLRAVLVRPEIWGRLRVLLSAGRTTDAVDPETGEIIETAAGADGPAITTEERTEGDELFIQRAGGEQSARQGDSGSERAADHAGIREGAPRGDRRHPVRSAGEHQRPRTSGDGERLRGHDDSRRDRAGIGSGTIPASIDGRRSDEQPRHDAPVGDIESQAKAEADAQSKAPSTGIEARGQSASRASGGAGTAAPNSQASAAPSPSPDDVALPAEVQEPESGGDDANPSPSAPAPKSGDEFDIPGFLDRRAKEAV